MAVNFLDELRKETKGKEDDLLLLKNDKEKFLDKLIDEWAKEKVASLKNSILKKVQKAEYSIVGDKREVSGDLWIGVGIFTNELWKKSKENKLLDDELKKQKIDKVLYPEFDFVKKGRKIYRDEGFHLDSWNEYKLKFSELGQKCIRKLETLAEKEGIQLEEFAFGVVPNEHEFWEMCKPVHKKVVMNSEIVKIHKDSDGELNFRGPFSTNNSSMNAIIIKYRVAY